MWPPCSRPGTAVLSGVVDYNEFEPERIKHMEMIQAVVARLAGNSFLMKGWAVTLTAAVLGFGVDRDDGWLAAAAFVPIAAFAILDAYYLRAERLFRALYNRVGSGDEEVKPFFMSATHDTFVKRLTPRERSWSSTIFSFTLFWFYFFLCVATLAVVGLIWKR
jgi:hypothetical protein